MQSFFQILKKNKKNIVKNIGPSTSKQEEQAPWKPLLSFAMRHDREYFIDNMAIFLSAGMGIRQALVALKNEVYSKRMKKILEQVLMDVEEGSPLWRSLASTGIFRVYTVALLRIGEEGGKLSTNLRVIATQQQKDRVFRSRVKTATIYPLVVMGLAVIIGLGIAIFLFPKLAEVFVGLNIPLPLPTRILIFTSIFLGKYGIIIAPALLVTMIAGVFFLFIHPKTRHLGDGLIRKIPFFSRLRTELEMARMGYILGSLLGVGMPMTNSLELLARSSHSRAYQKLYFFLVQQIEDGYTFYNSFTSYPHSSSLIPMPVQYLLFSGEQSGSIAGALAAVGNIYEEKAEITLKSMTLLMEPMLLVVVWVAVVFIASAVILPVYGIVGGLDSATI